MGWVAVAAWMAFNARLFYELFGVGGEPLAAQTTGRVVFFMALACLISPIMGIVLAVATWSAAQKRRPFFRGFLAGLAAGYFAWFSATILICIAYGQDGQTAIAATIVGAIGGAVNAVAGALSGAIWGWLQSRRRSGSEMRPDR